MTAKVILNPYARRWTALKRRPEAEAALQSAGVPYEIVQTEAPGHAITLAADAVKAGFDPIIAAGGDSTYNEVANGILLASTPEKTPAFGVLPLGTANDLPVNLGLPLDLYLAAQVIKAGNLRRLDVCRVNQRNFINNSGLGLEPYITTLQMKIQKVHGIARYLLATFLGILHNPRWDMDLTWSGNGATGHYKGPATLVSIGNSPRTGGLFFLTPHANAFDGLLTFTVGAAENRRQLLAMLPKAMRPGAGNVVEDPKAFEIHCTKLVVKSTPATPMHTDGEIVITSATELNYDLIPARLPLLSK